MSEWIVIVASYKVIWRKIARKANCSESTVSKRLTPYRSSNSIWTTNKFVREAHTYSAPTLTVNLTEVLEVFASKIKSEIDENNIIQDNNKI